MSSINPDSSRPRPPRAPRPDDATEAGAAPFEGRPGRRHGSGPEDDGPEPPLRRDEFRRGPGPFGPHGHHRPPQGGWGRGEGPMERQERPDPAAMAEQLFTKADVNGDGTLTQAELTAFYQEMASRRPARPTMPPELAPDSAQLVADPRAASSTAKVAAESSTVSDILASGLTQSAAETPNSEPAASDALDPTGLQSEVLAWLASLQEDPQFASLSEEQQQQLLQASQAVSALDPADPSFSEALQALLQSYGLAE